MDQAITVGGLLGFIGIGIGAVALIALALYLLNLFFNPFRSGH